MGTNHRWVITAQAIRSSLSGNGRIAESEKISEAEDRDDRTNQLG